MAAQEAKTGGSKVQSLPGVQLKFKASLRNFVRPCLGKEKGLGGSSMVEFLSGRQS